MGSINFFTEEIKFTLKQKIKLRNWIKLTIEHHHSKLEVINYIFTSDNYLSTINKDYLDHDTFTDIITFNQSNDPAFVEADIYMSVERIKDNAKNLNLPFTTELHRVMIHGILHLLGYDDKVEAEKNLMRKKENHYLALLV